MGKMHGRFAELLLVAYGEAVIVRKIWITWENQRRNREISKAIDSTLYELSHIADIEGRLRKYVNGIRETWNIYRRERPTVVFCQNPSLVLALFTVIVKRFFQFNVVVDAHNAGIFPAEGRSLLLRRLSAFIQRSADLTIVTNDALKRHVEANGGRGFVLQDKIPEIPTMTPVKLKGDINLLFICTYAEDEPYEAVFEAARRIDQKVCIYVTGNYRKRNIDPSLLPENVVLLGHVPEKQYLEMLNSVDATIDLTTRENCLVCGAYETVAVERPMILSDTMALRGYFSLGAVYADNTIDGFVGAINEFVGKKALLAEGVKQLKAKRQTEWVDRKSHLLELIGSWGRGKRCQE